MLGGWLRCVREFVVVATSPKHGHRFIVMEQPSQQTPRPSPVRRPPQMSLGFMMLMMVIFSVMSAGLFYASRVPAVQEEISVLVHGKSDGGGEDVGRLAHVVFIMFTFTSPLILAGVLSTTMAVLRWFQRRA